MSVIRRWSTAEKEAASERALAVLDDPERPIVYCYYGFCFGGPMSDQEVGDELGIPRLTVHRRRVKALWDMRRELDEWMGNG